MKILTALCLVVFCVSFSEQKANYANCSTDDIALIDPKIREECYNVICHPEEFGGYFATTCPEVACLPGTQIGYEEPDMSKTFPACCGRPICE